MMSMITNFQQLNIANDDSTPVTDKVDELKCPTTTDNTRTIIIL